MNMEKLPKEGANAEQSELKDEQLEQVSSGIYSQPSPTPRPSPMP